MVRSRRSVSKEDASSVLADSGISLSSPSGVKAPPFEEEEKLIQKLCITDDELDDNDFEETPLVYHIYEVSNEDRHSTDVDDDEDDDKEEEEKKKQSAKIPNPSHTLSAPTTNRRKRKEAEKSSEAALSSTGKKGIKRKRRTVSIASTSTDTTTATATTTTTTTTTTAKTKSRKSYKCHMCQKQFGGNNDLRRHLLIHTDERPFQCTLCDKSYRQAVNLKNHVSTIHSTQRQFRCTFCPKSFPLKDRLRLHMRLHSGEKPYECAHCDKRFARGGQLQQHMITHGAEVKTISCEHCSACFSSTANLRLHMKRHEEGPNHLCNICNECFISEEVLRTHVNMQHYKLKEFDCEVCNQKIEDEDLVSHLKTHSNIKAHVCEVCNALFMQKSQYNVHMRMHTGERPYQCRICWQSFAHSSVLKLHIRKHTGEKPFKCLLCKDDIVAFSQLAHLKTHMRKIHKQENPYMCTGCNAFFKVKLDLQTHMEQCVQCDGNANERMQNDASDSATLSHMRFLIAVLLKRISSEQKLYQLGYEKRLIDNVMIASLKLASRKTYDDHKMSEIERMRLNVQEFLNWIVPEKVMATFHKEQLTVEKTLDKIVTLYMKQQQQQQQQQQQNQLKQLKQ